jgi:hypothetical protein
MHAFDAYHVEHDSFDDEARWHPHADHVPSNDLYVDLDFPSHPLFRANLSLNQND